MAARDAPDLPASTSASQLTCFSMCGRKYFFTYCSDTVPEFISTNLVLGSAVHSSLAWFFEETLLGRTPTAALAEDVFTADFLAATIDKNVRWKDGTPDDLEAEGRRLVRTYLAAHASLPVVAVEKKFEVPLVDPETGEHLGRPLRGYFDFVLEDRIVELKTSARGWSEYDLPRHLQIGAYCFASHVLFPGLPTVETHVLVKLKKEPRVERFTIERSRSELGWWLAAASEIERAIEAKVFPPAPGPLCASCEFAHACLNLGRERDEGRRSLPVIDRPSPALAP